MSYATLEGKVFDDSEYSDYEKKTIKRMKSLYSSAGNIKKFEEKTMFLVCNAGRFIYMDQWTDYGLVINTELVEIRDDLISRLKKRKS